MPKDENGTESNGKSNRILLAELKGWRGGVTISLTFLFSAVGVILFYVFIQSPGVYAKNAEVKELKIEILAALGRIETKTDDLTIQVGDSLKEGEKNKIRIDDLKASDKRHDKAIEKLRDRHPGG